jgi:hypothetical protein
MQGFDEESGDAKQPVEVLQWPYHDLLVREGFTKAHSRRWECSSLLIMTHNVRNASLRLQLWGEWDFVCLDIFLKQLGTTMSWVLLF